MDIEGYSIIAILVVNGVVVLYLFVRLFFFFRKGKKGYDDALPVTDNLRKEEPNAYFLGDGAS